MPSLAPRTSTIFQFDRPAYVTSTFCSALVPWSTESNFTAPGVKTMSPRMLPSTRSCASPCQPVAVVVPAHFDGERGAVDAGERAGVERGGDVADFARLQHFLFDRRSRAAAARSHAEQLDFLLVNILGGEFVGGIGAAGDGAEIVLRFGEHFRRPGLGEARAGRGGDDNRSGGKNTNTHGTQPPECASLSKLTLTNRMRDAGCKSRTAY